MASVRRIYSFPQLQFYSRVHTLWSPKTAPTTQIAAKINTKDLTV